MIISTGVHSVTMFKVAEAEALIGDGVHYGYIRKISITSGDGSSYEITAFSDDKASLQDKPSKRESELEEALKECIAFLKSGECQPVSRDPQEQDTHISFDELDIDAQIEAIEIAIGGS